MNVNDPETPCIKIKGKDRPIKLTLGAIQCIEQDIGKSFTDAIGEIESKGYIGYLSTITYWMLKAGGYTELTKDDMLTLDIHIPDVTKAISAYTSRISTGDQETTNMGK